MDHLSHILQQVERYAEATGVSPDTVCRNATGNPRLYDRLKRRLEQTERDIQRLTQHLEDNPIKVPCATRHVLQDGNLEGNVKSDMCRIAPLDRGMA